MVFSILFDDENGKYISWGFTFSAEFRGQSGSRSWG